MLVVIVSCFLEIEKLLFLKIEKCYNIGCLYSILGFFMVLIVVFKV